MSTHGFLCFTNIEKDVILNSGDIEKILKDEIKIYKHMDGYYIGDFLSDFLKDKTLRRNEPESLSAWALYKLMDSADLSFYKNDKCGYYLTTHDNYGGWYMDYFFVVINGEEVLLYKYGEFKKIYTQENLKELKDLKYE